MAGSLTTQQAALLAAQKQMDLETEKFQSAQENESTKAKAQQTYHDALLAVIESLRGS